LLWALNAAVPTVTMMLLGNRAWRSVGFIALFFSLVIVGSYLLGFQGLGCLVLSTRNTTLLSSMNYLLAGLMLLFLAGAWWSFRRLVRHYQAKGYSDQMLIVDSLWLLVTLIETLGQMGPSGMASLYYLWAFAAYKSVSMIGLRRLSATQATDTPQALLMLRVFGFTSRTRQLTDQIGHYWRYSGPINMIGGTDLATSLIEPDELIQFWSRKLRQTFIADDADLHFRLDTMDLGRDPDLRYRINECFCHDNTWQATVKALAQRSAVVLMDLRGFGKKNRGCEFELEMLFEEVPVSRIVLLVDRTTELESLKQVLQSAWDKLSKSSSNHALTEPVLSLFQVEDSSPALQPVLSRLFAAAAAA
jgi:PII-like signaling protein